MKYYINRETNRLLIDENEYTPYLETNGYEEITKEEYDAKTEELLAEFQQYIEEQIESQEEGE